MACTSVARRHVVRVGVDLDELELVLLMAGERIELLDIFHDVAEHITRQARSS